MQPPVSNYQPHWHALSGKIWKKTLTKQTPLDMYLARPSSDTSLWYQFMCSCDRVPVISGLSAQASWPLTEEYCRTMLLLHTPNWRTISEVAGDPRKWIEKMQHIITTKQCPNFVKADIERTHRNIDPEIFYHNWTQYLWNQYKWQTVLWIRKFVKSVPSMHIFILWPLYAFKHFHLIFCLNIFFLNLCFFFWHSQKVNKVWNKY